MKFTTRFIVHGTHRLHLPLSPLHGHEECHVALTPPMSAATTTKAIVASVRLKYLRAENVQMMVGSTSSNKNIRFLILLNFVYCSTCVPC